MFMKDGNEIPIVLATAFEKDAYALSVFMRMRPSCQKRYTAYILDAKSENAIEKRVSYTITEVVKYGQKHNLG